LSVSLEKTSDPIPCDISEIQVGIKKEISVLHKHHGEADSLLAGKEISSPLE
jgi:hypothetical protein